MADVNGLLRTSITHPPPRGEGEEEEEEGGEWRVYCMGTAVPITPSRRESMVEMCLCLIVGRLIGTGKHPLALRWSALRSAATGVVDQLGSSSSEISVERMVGVVDRMTVVAMPSGSSLEEAVAMGFGVLLRYAPRGGEGAGWKCILRTRPHNRLWLYGPRPDPLSPFGPCLSKHATLVVNMTQEDLGTQPIHRMWALLLPS